MYTTLTDELKDLKAQYRAALMNLIDRSSENLKTVRVQDKGFHTGAGIATDAQQLAVLAGRIDTLQNVLKAWVKGVQV